MTGKTKQAALAGGVRATVVAIGVAAGIALTPAGAIASGAPDHGANGVKVASVATAPAVAAVQTSAFSNVQTPALSPGLPPPQLAALSDRRIVAGLILVLFAGLAGITATMWRDLGQQFRGQQFRGQQFRGRQVRGQ